MPLQVAREALQALQAPWQRSVRGRLQDQGPLPGPQVLLRHYQGQVRKLFPNFRENKLASHGLVSGAMFVNLANLFKTKIPTDNLDSNQINKPLDT